MQGRQSGQASFHAMIYEELIPADHLLRRLSAAVDFSSAPDHTALCCLRARLRSDNAPAATTGPPDPDARFDRKSDTKSFYGYKKHLGTDADSDAFELLVDRDAREVTADKGYYTNVNHRHLQANGQRSSIMVKKNRVNPQVMRRADPDSWRKRPSIERKFAEQKKYHGLR